MIGRRVLPCGHHRVRLEEEAGTFTKVCDTCKREFIAEVSASAYWTRKLSKPSFVLHWLEEDELPTPEERDTVDATSGVHGDGGEQ